MNGSGGIILLIIIGIVINMLVKAMRAKPQQKRPPQRPAQPPTLGQDIARPIEDRPRPQTIPGLKPRQDAYRKGETRMEERDLTKGVSLEGTSLEGQSQEGKPRADMPEMMEPAGVRDMVSHPVTEWFRDGGIVRGIVMSEILRPPVSRRR
jgi:hypothetical protein